MRTDDLLPRSFQADVFFSRFFFFFLPGNFYHTAVKSHFYKPQGAVLSDVFYLCSAFD